MDIQAQREQIMAWEVGDRVIFNQDVFALPRPHVRKGAQASITRVSKKSLSPAKCEYEVTLEDGMIVRVTGAEVSKIGGGPSYLR